MCLKLSEQRIKDLVTVAACSHYRLCCSLDTQTMTYVPLASKASELNLLFTFSSLPREEVLQTALNRVFDYNAGKPLWHIDIIAHPCIAGDGICLARDEQEAAERNVQYDPSFSCIFSFNHCLGDGISMLAFAKTFLNLCVAQNFNKDSLDLHLVEVSKEPPELLDNYINPSCFGVICRKTI
jgi:hypothetical protein